jgi:excisionase family DNA binding protein
VSDFLLDLHRSHAHQGFAKILNIATGMPAVFAKPYAYDLSTSLRKKSLILGLFFLDSLNHFVLSLHRLHRLHRLKLLSLSKKMDKEYISLPQAAKICAISRWTLRSYVKSGEINASRTPGGHYRIAQKDLTAFISKMGMHPPANSRAAAKTILVVDDDAKIRKLLARVLHNKDVLVATASDGFEAGQMTIKLKPDLVILDIFMPQIDGFEVCRRLRQESHFQNVSVWSRSRHAKILTAGIHGVF